VITLSTRFLVAGSIEEAMAMAMMCAPSLWDNDSGKDDNREQLLKKEGLDGFCSPFDLV
jgi:hypothetical protein